MICISSIQQRQCEIKITIQRPADAEKRRLQCYLMVWSRAPSVPHRPLVWRSCRTPPSPVLRRSPAKPPTSVIRVCFVSFIFRTWGIYGAAEARITLYIGNTCIDVSAAVLPGHGLGEANDPSLGGAVVGLPDVADDPGNWCDVDDPSLSEVCIVMYKQPSNE